MAKDFINPGRQPQPRTHTIRNALPGEVFAWATDLPRGTALGDGITWRNVSFLRAAYVRAVNNLDGWYVQNVPRLPVSTTTDYTFEAIGYWVSSGTFDIAPAFLLGRDPRTGSPYRGLTREQGYLVMSGHDGFTNAPGGPTLSANVWSHCFIRKTSAGVSYWVKRLDTKAIVTSSVALPSSQADLSSYQNVSFLQGSSTTAPETGIAKVAVYNYGLEDAQIQTLLDRPWLNFEARKISVYSLPAAGGGFLAAWAAGSNQFIGSGVHAA